MMTLIVLETVDGQRGWNRVQGSRIVGAEAEAEARSEYSAPRQ